MSKPIRIYDLPYSQGQLHLHGDPSGNTIYGGKLIDYSRKAELNLNGYEASMAELNATSLGLKRIDPK